MPLTIPVSTALIVFLFMKSIAQHGIDYCWSLNQEYQLPKVNSAASDVGGVANNMAVEPDSTVLVFWNIKEQGFSQILYAGSNDKGKSWNNPTPVYLTPAIKTKMAASVSAAADTNGNIYVSWHSSSLSTLFCARFDYNSKTWSDTVRVISNTNATSVYQSLTVDRNGIIHIVWNDLSNKHTNINEVYYSRSIDNGKTWQAQKRLSEDDGNPSLFPVADFIGTASDTLAFVWRDSIDKLNDWDIMMATTNTAGKFWANPQTVSGGLESQHDPNLIIDKAGIFHLLYDEYISNGNCQGGCIQMKYGYSLNKGKTWQGGFHAVSDTSIRSRLPKSAYDYTNDIVWLSWKDERNFDILTGSPHADIMVMQIKNGGKYWGAPEFVTDQHNIEVGFHNFKVKNDGSLAATYNYDFESTNPLNLYYREYGCDVTNTGFPTQLDSIDTGENYLLLYPNPTDNQLTLSINNSEENITEILIYNTNGQLLIHESTTSQNIAFINTTFLKTGIYLLLARTYNTQYHKTFILQNTK